MRYIALVDQCWPCFGLAIARMTYISKGQDCRAATRRAAQLVWTAQFSEAQHLTSFPVASVQAVKASIRRYSSEGWKVSLDRVLVASFQMAWVPL